MDKLWVEWAEYMRPEFTSVFSKIGRAEAHYKVYEQETLKWAEQIPTAISLVGNDDGSRYTVMAENIYPPDLERWSLIAADCVHNLRCALDHLVYALAIQDRKIDPPTKKRYLQFPITESESEFATQEFRMAGHHHHVLEGGEGVIEGKRVEALYTFHLDFLQESGDIPAIEC